MVKIFQDFFLDEDGLGTVEIVLLIAVLVGLALIFRNQIVGFVKDTLSEVTGTEGDFDPNTISN